MSPFPLLAAAAGGAGSTLVAGAAWYRWRRTHPSLRDRYRALVEQGIDKFSVIDASGSVVYVSPGAERVYGVPAEDLVGPFRLDDLVHPDDRGTLLAALELVKRIPAEPVRVETRVLHHDGSWRTVASTYVNRLDDPAIRGIVCSEVDITAGRAERDSLAREAQFNALVLQMVSDASAVGMRELVASSGATMSRLASVFRAEVAWIEADGWRGEDGRRVGSIAGEAFEQPARPGSSFAVGGDLRVLGPGEQPDALARLGVLHSVSAPAFDGAVVVGSVVFARTSDEPFDTVAERHVRLLATLVGQRLGRARSDAERSIADHRAAMLATHVREAVFTIDLKGNLTWASPATTRASGMSMPMLTDTSLTDFVHDEDLGHIVQQAAAVVAGGAASAIPARLKAIDGSLRWAEVDIDVHTRAADGRVRELVVVVRDVHEHHLRAERLSAQALIDPLTGAVNRPGLLSELRRLSEDVGVGFAVAFCDLDGFKAVNDDYGHSAGDEALRVVADRLRSALRPSDMVARFGGDEFVLLLHDVDQAVARQVCGRVIESIAEPMVVGAGPVRVTASVGVVLAEAGLEPLHLISLADAAMYEAKRSGKNRLVLTSGSAGGASA